VAGRPLLGLLSVSVFAAGASLLMHRQGIVPDPLALGALPAGLIVALLCALASAYLVLLGLALALRVRA